jgi:uncharacterized OB-fold protein
MIKSLRLLPSTTKVEAPFWNEAKKNNLVLQKCVDCNKFIFYPRLYCPHCLSPALTWEKASGKGKVYTYTVVVSNCHSSFISNLPFVIAIIELDEGVRMLSNVVGCGPEDVRCDMPVEVVFEELNDDFNLPKFKPVTK